MSSILCIGIGNMGAALAETLLRAGNNITIWNRTSDRPLVKSLVESGATLASDLGQAITDADFILVCVLDYPSFFSALKPFTSALSGKTMLNLTNGTPKEAIEAQQWAQEHSVSKYFDGAIMVTPQLVGTPQSFLICSGEKETVFKESIFDIVSSLGTPMYVGEDVSTAAASDIAALAALYGMFSGVFIGIGLLKKRLDKAGGGNLAPAVNGVVVPVLKALVPYVSLIAEGVDKEEWDDNMGNPLGMQLTGLNNVLQACKEESVNGTGLESLLSLMQKVVDARGGDGSVAEVARYIAD